MNIYGFGITPGTTVVSGSGDSWVVSISQTVPTTTGYYQSNSFGIVSISGNIMTTSGNPNLGYGMRISGPGIAIGNNIVGGSGNVWNIKASNTLAGPLTANYILPNVVTFPLSELYYIIPSYIRYNPIFITIPSISSSNVTAKTCFRLVGVNAPINPAGSSVYLQGDSGNIYPLTSSSAVSLFTMYTTNSVIFNAYNFYCIPTNLNPSSNPGYGWFQV
jgi:hypothetical protein